MLFMLIGWSVGFNLQGSAFQGNSEMTVITARLEGAHRVGHTKFSAFVKTGYSLQDTQVVANTLEGGLQMDLPLSSRWEAFLLASYFADPVAKVSYRSDGGAGLKYRFLEAPDREISMSLAPLYAIEKYAGSEPSRDVRLSFRPKLEWKTASGVTLKVVAFYQPAISDWSDARAVALFRVEAPLGAGLSLMVEVEDRYTTVVPEGVKPNDLRITTGIAWKMERS